MTGARSLGLTTLAGIVLLAVPIGAQDTPVIAAAAVASGALHSVSLSAGTFNYEAGGERYYPFAVLRAHRELSRFFVLEGAIGYTATQTWTPADGGALTARSPLVVSDVSVQFQFAVGPIRPYLGAGAGLVSRLAAQEPDGRFVRPSYAAGGGIRAKISPRLGLRGDLRVRLDMHPGFTSVDYEQTIGVALRF